jgi:uncharacterized BrkB/YihY/UPF0761 family membrane protein
LPVEVVHVCVSALFTDVAVKVALTAVALRAPPSTFRATAIPALASAAITIAAMVSFFIRIPPGWVVARRDACRGLVLAPHPVKGA